MDQRADRGAYRIGEVAEATGFPPTTLRYYEDQGLLPPPERTPAGQRVYRQAHLERLRLMARGKELGLTLAELAELADAWQGEDCAVTHERLVELLDAKLAEVREQIAGLTRFADRLAQAHRRAAQEPSPQGACGPDCGCAPALALHAGSSS